MRKIALITTSRADYGIQSNLITELQQDKEIDFYLLVSGTHLSEKHGLTYKEIEQHGNIIYKKIDIGMDEYNESSEIVAKAVVEFSKALNEIKPDIVVLLGDRFEMMAASYACTLNNIPIAHLHGGETTEGANDEVFRHSITKAAHLHFTSCEEYQKRVIQLGESPNRVFNVGSLGVENIKKIKSLTKEELSESLGVEFSKKNLLVTFHPVTLEEGQVEAQIDELLKALSELEETTLIFTGTNIDSGGDIISLKIKDFVKMRKKTYSFTSLGMLRYLSMVNVVDAVVGNSSSGIIEVPSFKTATVNIGNRQKGRIQAQSVISCKPIKDEIAKAIEKVFSLEFKEVLKNTKNPYEKENTLQNIINTLKTFDLDNVLKKEFYDLNFQK